MTAEGTPTVPRRRGRRMLAIVALLMLVELVVVAGVAAWAVLGARQELMDARTDAAAGRQSAQQLDLVAAEASFVAAEEHFEHAREQLRNPAVRVLAMLPVVGDDLRTAEALAVSGGLVAAAATDVVGYVTDQPEGLRSLLPSDGRFPVDRLRDLAATADRAAQHFADADAIVAATPDDGLLEPVAQARAQFTEELAQARALVASVAGVGDALAALLGEDGPRRYLFGAQNPAELRGTGGYIGAYAVATFDRGRFALSRFTPIQRLQSLPVSDVPPPNADYAARYNRFGGAGFWPAINATPDFPSAARAMVELYDRTEGDRLDGVIVVDPHALRALLSIVGDVRVPGIGRVAADEVVAVVSNEAYRQFATSEERKEVLGAVAATALRRLLRGEASFDPAALLGTLAPAMADRHLLLYSTDASVQDTLRQLDMAGALPVVEHDAIAVVVNNTAVNKVDFYVDRTVDYRVRLRRDGSAMGRLRVAFRNNAPASGSAYVLGPNAPGLEIGDDRSLVSVFCGRCEPTRARPLITSGGIRSGMVLGSELGHTVATTLVTVPQGTTRSVELAWRLDDAWSPATDGCYAVRYAAQPTIRPTTLRVVVTPPAGFERRRADGHEGPSSRLHAGPAAGVVAAKACYSQ